VPGEGASIHMMFREQGAPVQAAGDVQECGLLSVFVQRDTGDIPLRDGVTYSIETAEGGPLVVLWSRDGLVYYLITETAEAQELVMRAMEAPPARARL